MKKIMKKLFVTAICILCSHWLLAGEIWISPKGSDFNDGTRQSPKATLTSALRQAREWRRTEDNRIQGGITIYMEGGTYAFHEPVFIRPEDSGTKESPTIIRSVGDEKVILSGGISINGWKKQGKVWVADVPAFNGRPLDFRQLWVSMKRLTYLLLCLFASIAFATAQTAKVTGTVISAEDDGPIIGASIVVAGTTTGTVTDYNGAFTLDVPSNAKKLIVSYIGMKSVEVAVKPIIKVTMESDSQNLDEVVVVGYGTQKKINLTGAVESISSDVIEDRPIKSVADALQGTALGVTVTSAAGQPGEFSKIKIRGDASLNSDGALVLIDGMPGDLNQVNPQDIENISVLKDAASSAIYGARAAEGVILVTTKSGKSTKTRVEYSGNISFNTPTRIPESTTAAEHARLSNLAFTNAGLAPNFTEEAINAINNHSTVSIPKGNDWIYTADMDWIDLMMDRSFQQQHNLTVSRSQESLKYLFSAGWLDQDGMFSEYGPDNFDRFNLRSNVNLDIVKDKLNLDSRITFSRMDQRYHPKFGEWTIPYIREDLLQRAF